MGSRLLKTHCCLDAASNRSLHRAVDGLGLSARAYHRILKIVRTAADLAGKDRIDSTHVGEAIQYRRMQYDTV